MPTNSSNSEPTFAVNVMESLDALAANKAKAARALDACDTIRDFQGLLATNLATAIKRHSPKEITQQGHQYLVFVIPSPLALIKAVDTFCIIYRPDDSRFHVHLYANCNSMQQYEETRSKMRLEINSHPNIAQLLV